MQLLTRFLNRLLTMAVTLFGVAVVVFVVIRIAPGDPIAMMLPPGASQADIDRLRALYGLDRSLGDRSSSSGCRASCTAISAPRSRCGRTCSTLVASRLPATLELSILALIIAVALGVPLAVARRAPPRHGGRGGHRRRQRRGAVDPGFPVGAAVHPAVRRAGADVSRSPAGCRRASSCPSSPSSTCSKASCGCASISPAICLPIC